jgi:hypothetical protein
MRSAVVSEINVVIVVEKLAAAKSTLPVLLGNAISNN